MQEKDEQVRVTGHVKNKQGENEGEEEVHF